jgi:hypothetical protein
VSAISHPSHYNAGKIEVIEFINDQQLNYERGCVIKYTCRAGRKDPKKECEDLQKAIWYLQWEVEKLTAAAEGRAPRRPNDLNPRATSATAASPLGRPVSTTDTVPTVRMDHVPTLDGLECARCYVHRRDWERFSCRH